MREFRRLRDAGLPVTSEVRARHVWATNDGYATGPDVGHRIPGFALPDQWGDPNFKRPLRPEDRAHTEFLKVIRRRQCPIIALGLARFRDRHVVGVISEQPGEGPRAIAQIREVHVRKWWRWMLASFAPLIVMMSRVCAIPGIGSSRVELIELRDAPLLRSGLRSVTHRLRARNAI